MISGLFALLDDIAAIAKTAVASLDDVALQAVRASKNAAGIVIDDAAVTPRYVVGMAAARELPVIGRIAWGSIKNKLLYLLPAALLLTAFAPWAITPLLMVGGAYLCFEGYEKLHAMVVPEARFQHVVPEARFQHVVPEARFQHVVPEAAPVSKAVEMPSGDPKVLEDAKVASAIRTDFILSAEIMALTLASLTMPDLVSKALTLAVVAVLVTGAVYGAVALIVKADDFGVYLARDGSTETVRAFGRRIVTAMPPFLKGLTFVGMLAMLWVGGGIILHGLDAYGLGSIPHAVDGVAAQIGGVFGPLAGAVTWLVAATVAGLFGVVIGWVVAKTVGRWMH